MLFCCFCPSVIFHTVFRSIFLQFNCVFIFFVNLAVQKWEFRNYALLLQYSQLLFLASPLGEFNRQIEDTNRKHFSSLQIFIRRTELKLFIENKTYGPNYKGSYPLCFYNLKGILQFTNNVVLFFHNCHLYVIITVNCSASILHKIIKKVEKLHINNTVHCIQQLIISSTWLNIPCSII